MSLRRDLQKSIRVFVQRAASLLGRRTKVVQMTPDALLSDVRTRGVVDQFHQIFYASVEAGQVRWLGHEILKNPLDLWLVQEILHDKRPDVLIETGTHHGGSALFYAGIAKAAGLDLRVITIDFNPKLEYDAAAHNILSVTGISTTSATVARVQKELADLRQSLGREPKVMVVLDSDHSRENVLEELKTYAPLVSVGQYVIVEDTNVNGHPVFLEHGPGPYEATEEFLAGRTDFVRDPKCHKFLVTQNPDGWLLRVR